MEALLDGEAEELTRRCVEAAKAGDMVAMRLCFERLSPPRKDRPVLFRLPKLSKATDAVEAMSEITEGVAIGELTPAEASELSRIVDVYARTLQVADIEERLVAVERRITNETRSTNAFS